VKQELREQLQNCDCNKEFAFYYDKLDFFSKTEKSDQMASSESKEINRREKT
jgi:hypothetical protein